MSSFLYLLGLGFLLASIGSCATSAAPIGGYAHMLAWVLCWVGGGIIERLPAPARAGFFAKSSGRSDGALPVTVTEPEKADMRKYGIEYRAGEYWIGNEHYLRVGDAIARGRAMRNS